jgi:hypothetical protein
LTLRRTDCPNDDGYSRQVTQGDLTPRASAAYRDGDFGPAMNHAITPITGSTMISTIQNTLDPVLAPLPATFTIA